MTTAVFILLAFFAMVPFYLIGAFPSGAMIAKMHGVRIEAHGSGNVGATNVSRVIGTKPGLFTLLLDVSKGSLGVLIAFLVFKSSAPCAAAAFCVVAGHCFSIPGRLRGGKGVATALGVLLASDPLLAVVALAVFSLVFYCKRIVSLASVSTVLIVPIIGFLRPLPESFQIALAGIALMVFWRHRENLTRLTRGEEPAYHTSKAEQMNMGEVRSQ